MGSAGVPGSAGSAGSAPDAERPRPAGRGRPRCPVGLPGRIPVDRHPDVLRAGVVGDALHRDPGTGRVQPVVRNRRGHDGLAPLGIVGAGGPEDTTDGRGVLSVGPTVGPHRGQIGRGEDDGHGHVARDPSRMAQDGPGR